MDGSPSQGVLVAHSKLDLETELGLISQRDKRHLPSGRIAGQMFQHACKSLTLTDTCHRLTISVSSELCMTMQAAQHGSSLSVSMPGWHRSAKPSVCLKLAAAPACHNKQFDNKLIVLGQRGLAVGYLTLVLSQQGLAVGYPTPVLSQQVLAVRYPCLAQPVATAKHKPCRWIHMTCAASSDLECMQMTIERLARESC